MMLFFQVMGYCLSIGAAQQYISCDSTHGFWIRLANDSAYVLQLEGKVSQTTQNNILVCSNHVTQWVMANVSAFQPDGGWLGTDDLLMEYALQETEHQSGTMKTKLKPTFAPFSTIEFGKGLTWWYAVPPKVDETIRHQVFAAVRAGSVIVALSAPHPRMESMDTVTDYLRNLLASMKVVPGNGHSGSPIPCR